MKHNASNLEEILNLIDEHWAPKAIAEMNDYQDGEPTAVNDAWT